MIHILKFIFAIHFLTSCNILRDVSDSETNLDDEFFQGRGLESFFRVVELKRLVFIIHESYIFG